MWCQNPLKSGGFSFLASSQDVPLNPGRRHLRPKAPVYRVADTNGLCIEVHPSGAKLWRYRYRLAGKAGMAVLSEYPLMPRRAPSATGCTCW